MNKDDFEILKNMGIVPTEVECMYCCECILTEIKRLQAENAELKAQVAKLEQKKEDIRL